LQYELVKGEGPATGWISTEVGSKKLIEKVTSDESSAPAEAEQSADRAPAEAEQSAEVAGEESEPKVYGDKTTPAGRFSISLQNDSFIKGLAEPFHPLPDDLFEKIPKPGEPPRMSLKKFKEIVDANLPGDFHGIKFPHSPEQLQEWGPEWLTKAFHTTGSIPKDLKVVKFTSFRVLAGDTTKVTENKDDGDWGGAGRKVLLGVEYDREAPEVACEFFIKLPHELTPKSERFKCSVTLNNDFPAVTFSVMCLTSLPFRTPLCYYADISRDSTNFIIIYEKAYYADRGTKFSAIAPYQVLPAPGKYKDFELDNNGWEYYYAQTRSYARMCAWYHRSIALSPQLDYLFAQKGTADFFIAKRIQKRSELGPIETRHEDGFKRCKEWGPEAVMGMAQGSMGLDPKMAESFMELCDDFIVTAKKLFKNQDVCSDAFRKQLKEEVAQAVKLSGLVNFWVSEIFPELNVLTHPNLQVDNALYWRDDKGQLLGGILDWDSVQHMPIPGVLSGGWHGAEVEVMDAHEEKLCHAFVDELISAGGSCCAKDHLHVLVKCNRAVNFPGMFANLGKLYQLVPRKIWPEITGRFDPRLLDAFLPRCYSAGPVLQISGWKSRNPLPYLKQFARDCGLRV